MILISRVPGKLNPQVKTRGRQCSKSRQIPDYTATVAEGRAEGTTLLKPLARELELGHMMH